MYCPVIARVGIGVEYNISSLYTTAPNRICSYPPLDSPFNPCNFLQSCATSGPTGSPTNTCSPAPWCSGGRKEHYSRLTPREVLMAWVHPTGQSQVPLVTLKGHSVLQASEMQVCAFSLVLTDSRLTFEYSAVVVQSISRVWLCEPMNCSTPGFLSFTIFWTMLKFLLMILSSHLILCHPLLLLPSIFPSIKVFSIESALCIRWPKYCSFSISPSNEYSELISFRADWFNLLTVQETI